MKSKLFCILLHLNGQKKKKKIKLLSTTSVFKQFLCCNCACAQTLIHSPPSFVPWTQMRMPSPSSTRPQGNAWAQVPPRTRVSPCVTRAAGPSCGSGAQVAACTTWTQPCAWRSTWPARRCRWWTAAPASSCGGAAWTEWCTPPTRWPWPWPTTRTRWRPNASLTTPGCEEDLSVTSATSPTVVSQAFILLNLIWYENWEL